MAQFLWIAVALVSCCLLTLADKTENINGYYAVKEGRHYSNKTSITWGKNSETFFSVSVSLSESCASYDLNADNCPEDPSGNGDWNKLWGKLLAQPFLPPFYCICLFDY